MSSSSSSSSVARTEAALAAIADHNERTNAFITIDAEGALAQARERDDEAARGMSRSPLHGAPVAVKDLVDVAGMRTTAGSQVLADNVSAFDAPVITRLRAAGVVIIGKTNMHEFAFGTTSEDSGFGPVRHPSDAARMAGGSSGGSAVAVATGMSEMAVGSDTGGSIRIPSSLCGVVGLKPSFDDVPTQGVVPLSTTFDHVGPITRTVEDAAAMWRAMADRPNDIVLQPAAPELRFAMLGAYFTHPAESSARAIFEHTVEAMRRASISIETRDIPNSSSILQTYVNVSLPEATAWHQRFLDERGERYQPIIRTRLLAGRDVRAVDYIQSRAACAVLRDAVDAALQGVDALILPAVPITAPLLGETELTLDGTIVTTRAIMLRNTQLFNMTGHPAITLPMRTPDGILPCGLQLVGRINQTARLLAIAAACEKII